jgi:hypothetical protein
MIRSYPFALCLFLAFCLAACRKDVHTGNGGGLAPGQGQTPAAISSSAQVVKVTSSPVTISQNGPVDALVTLSISPGFHINANPATFSYLIATEVSHTVDPDESLPMMGKPIYPMPVTKKFAFADKRLAVYEGEVSVKLPLHLPDPKRTYGQIRSGPLSFPITIRVQACDEQQCFPPATINSTISVTVK